MTYYKVVKPITIWAEVKGWSRHYGEVRHLVMGELYTERELSRFHIPERVVERIELPKSRTCWSFGCRFSIDDFMEGRV